MTFVNETLADEDEASPPTNPGPRRPELMLTWRPPHSLTLHPTLTLTLTLTLILTLTLTLLTWHPC
jgi:hypothetical protein